MKITVHNKKDILTASKLVIKENVINDYDESVPVKYVRLVILKGNCIEDIAEFQLKEDKHRYGLFTKAGKFRAFINDFIDSIGEYDEIDVEGSY